MEAVENKLYFGDNLQILRKYIKDESVDLIYLDPPFNSKADYNILYKEASGEKSKAQITAFTDFWHWDEEAQMTFEYLTTSQNVPIKVSKLINSLHDFLGNNDMSAYLVMMAVRLIELHRVLKPTGSLYLHCDPTASHYLKLVLDAIFDAKNFISEIIWAYGTSSGGRSKGRKPVKGHDTIFAYAKSYGLHTYNKLYLPYDKNYIERWFKYVDENGRRYQKRMRGRDEKGEIIWEKQYLDESKGIPLSDTWADIKQLYADPRAYKPNQKKYTEILGFETQKPVALLERIIKMASNSNDIILDPFCGCGTTIDAVEKVNLETGSHRTWIGIDITHLAINLIKRRIHDKYPNATFEVIGEPKDLEGAKQLALQDRYQFQWWALSLVDARPINDKKKGSDKGIDGIIYLLEPNTKTIKTVLVQVKSGNVTVKDIRDFIGTIEREKEKKKTIFGIFITLEEPTKDMKEEALNYGFEEAPISHEKIPRIQILTIKELLEGVRPKILFANISYREIELPKEKKKKKFEVKNLEKYKKFSGQKLIKENDKNYGENPYT